MKLKTPTRLALAVAASLTMASAHADSLSFSRMYTLGDSLTDGGAFGSRFTNNGPDARMYSEVLADRLGLRLPVVGGLSGNADGSDGGNYAQGGARVSVDGGPFPISVETQIDDLFNSRASLSKRDLVIVWAGANDGFAEFAQVAANALYLPTAVGVMAATAQDLADQVERLKNAGAKNVVVVLLPDLAKTPLGTLVGASGQLALSSLSSSFNSNLKNAAGELNAFVLDPNRILGAILADPTKFGFNASTLNIGATACGINPTPVNLPGDFYNSSQTCVNNNPNNYLFADSVHPTTQAHDIFAAILMGSLRAIGQASYLATGPMISARQHAMELENRLHLNAFSKADGKSRPVGDTQVYGGAESGGFKQGSGQIDPSVDLSSQRYRIGIDQQLTSSVMGGALFTYGQSKTDFGSNTGEIKTNEVSAVLYASKALSANTYINASFGMGTIDHSFRREIALDTTTLVSRSSPKGEYESFRIGGGAVYEVNGWRIGPSASFALENVTIDQFDENQGPSSMSFGKIDYSVQRLTAGLSLDQIASVGQWRGFGRLVHDWDLKSGDLEIKVGPDSSTLAKFDIDRPGKTMWQATLGIMRPATDGSTLSFSVGFGGREGGGDTKTIGVNYRIEL